MNTPVADASAINELLARYGVKFGIYKNGTFKEQLVPWDAIPRVITAEDFSAMERGLVQRVDALNLFLKDIYSDGKIIRDKVVPEDFVYISKGYLAQCAGIAPPKGIYSHISGIDLKGKPRVGRKQSYRGQQELRLAAARNDGVCELRRNKRDSDPRKIQRRVF